MIVFDEKSKENYYNTRHKCLYQFITIHPSMVKTIQLRLSTTWRHWRKTQGITNESTISSSSGNLQLSLHLFPLCLPRATRQRLTTLRLAIHTCMHIYQGRPEGPRKLGPAAWAGHWSFWLSVVWEKRGRQREVGDLHSFLCGRQRRKQHVCMYVCALTFHLPGLS